MSDLERRLRTGLDSAGESISVPDGDVAAVVRRGRTRRRRVLMNLIVAAVVVVAVGAVWQVTRSVTPAPFITPNNTTTPSTTVSTTTTTAATTTTTVEIDWVAYVADALDLMEEHYYKTDEVDWGQIRTDAMDEVQAHPSKAMAYETIRDAIQAMGGYHMFLQPYQEIAPGTVEHSDPPSGGRIELDTGAAVGEVVLTPLPSILSDQWATYATQGQDLLRAADEADPVCGWVVDLRTTGRESLPPFLLAVAPLLGPGVPVSYVGPEENHTFSYEDGQLYFDGEPLTELVDTQIAVGADPAEVEAFKAGNVVADPYVPHDPDAPVAVLISHGTASASEIVLVAFLGRPDTRTFGSTTSYGLPTGNEDFTLADGSTILITVGEAQDRLGNLYDGPILPDQLVAALPADSGDDPVLDAALAWLADQAGCR